MENISDKLFELADRLGRATKEWASSGFLVKLSKLKEAADEIGNAWSGSWLGYQSRVYYANLKTPPPGAHFSRDWGLRSLEFIDDGTRGDWRECEFEHVVSSIRKIAKVNVKDLEEPVKQADRLDDLFEECKGAFLSQLSIVQHKTVDSYLEKLKEEAERLKILGWSDFAEGLQPRGKFITHDSVAANQGIQIPPHINVHAHLFELEQPAECCEKLAKLCSRAASHLESRERQDKRKQRIGTKVFIGHGRSRLWKDLKDFIQDRLKLPWDEFNRVPVAGVTNISRLSEMLDDAAVAFLVMTAEDEQRDGSVRARMNVIHEAGLFQGRLGFTRAIVLLEDGCEEFSNIHGLGQIRFPVGNIQVAFEDVRQVLEREGLIES